jgi:hypothetical protein
MPLRPKKRGFMSRSCFHRAGAPRRRFIALAALLTVGAVSAPAAAQDAAPRLLPALSLALSSRSALAQDGYHDPNDLQPSTGTGLIVAGWIAVGVGLLNLATLPICFADFYPSESKDLCVGMSAAIAGVGVAVGVPLLIIGYNQRADYKEWKQRRGLTHHLRRLRLSLRDDAALIVYGGEL